jgi:hypothetical protein
MAKCSITKYKYHQAAFISTTNKDDENAEVIGMRRLMWEKGEKDIKVQK